LKLLSLAHTTTGILRNFLLTVLNLRVQHKALPGNQRDPAVLGASFRVIYDPERGQLVRAGFRD
jgi:hypothetical protein